MFSMTTNDLTCSCSLWCHGGVAEPLAVHTWLASRYCERCVLDLHGVTAAAFGASVNGIPESPDFVQV